jgi:hypothetical protein
MRPIFEEKGSQIHFVGGTKENHGKTQSEYLIMRRIFENRGSQIHFIGGTKENHGKIPNIS